jgi:phosphoribosylanthranilate isomerase
MIPMRPELVKVCGITRSEDAKHCINLGANALGFIFHPSSPRNLSLDNFKIIQNGISFQNCLQVAVAVAPEPSMVEQFLEAGFDRFQFHFPADYSHQKIADWAEVVGKQNLWLAPRLNPDEEFPAEILKYAQTMLIDTYSDQAFGGTGRLSDWNRFKALKKQYSEHQWYLAGGLGPENLYQAINETEPDGVDLNSGVEISPGIKDLEKINQVFSLF